MFNLQIIRGSHPDRKISVLACLVMCLIALTPKISCAEDFPNRPVRLIVPYAAGGGIDVAARLFADGLSRQLGQSIVVENRGGAGGNVGTAAAARSDPDGYTLLFTAQGPISIAPILQTDLNYDPKKELLPVVMAVRQPALIIVNKDVKANSLSEFVRLAKSAPGRINFGSSGAGTEMHLTGELMKSKLGIEIVHVPYRGGGPAIAALLAGEIQMMVVVASAVAHYVANGDVKAIATTSPTRLAAFPQVPTMTELGLSEINTMPWFGVFVRSGTPPKIVDRLTAAALAMASDAEYKRKLSVLGIELVNLPGAKFAETLRLERSYWQNAATLYQGKPK